MDKETLVTELSKNCAFGDLPLDEVSLTIGKPFFRLTKIIFMDYDEYDILDVFEPEDISGTTTYLVPDKIFDIGVNWEGSGISRKAEEKTTRGEISHYYYPVGGELFLDKNNNYVFCLADLSQDGKTVKIKISNNQPETLDEGKGEKESADSIIFGSDAILIVAFKWRAEEF